MSDTCGTCKKAEPTDKISKKNRTLNMIWCPEFQRRFTPEVHKLCNGHEYDETKTKKD